MIFRAFRKKRNMILDPDEVLMDTASALGAAYGSEGKIERPLSLFTVFLFSLFVILGMGYLSYRAFVLQVMRGHDFFEQAQTNRFFTRTIAAPRGIIYDRFGASLVENRPSFGVLFEREKFLQNKGNLENLLRTLGAILKKEPEFFYEAGFPRDGDPNALPTQIVVLQGIEPAEAVKLSLQIENEPSISVFETQRRIYQDPFAFSHLLGFVGKVSESDMLRGETLRHSDIIGKEGIELVYDAILRGSPGRKILEVDANGNETRYRFIEEPRIGSHIQLAIDGDFQKFSYATFESYTKGTKGGSIVAINPRNGAVRSIVSFPGFDGNRFGYSLSVQEFSEVLNNPLRPMFHRAVSGEFPSGSTIKPLVATAALEERLIDPRKKIYDSGSLEIPNPYHPGERSIFVDWKPHGWVDFYDAIAVSANVYFYMIGGGYQDQKGLGIERLKKYATAFGLGSVLGIDLPGERPGLFPDPLWKTRAEPGNPIWRIGDTYNVSIGQGGVKVTPLQMAVATAAIANGGTVYQPYIFERVVDGGAGQESNHRRETSRTPKIINTGFVRKDSLSEVVKGMRQTVTAGTARLLSEIPKPVAAKTGTAQAGSGLSHAWVTAFAPVENPEIAVAVMVEHAGEGATVAVPIMRDILQWYFNPARHALRGELSTPSH